MTREVAVRLACDFVGANGLEVDKLESANFITFPTRDESSIPLDIIETYLSVKSGWRDYWAVRFRKAITPGLVECPSTELICVYETGEVVHKLSM